MKPIAFFSVFFLIVYFTIHQSNKKGYESYKRAVASNYTGVVIDKFYLKAQHIKIKTENGIQDIAFMTPELAGNVKIGDTIIKISNRNSCYLNKRKYKYAYIPAYVMNNKDWPIEYR